MKKLPKIYQNEININRKNNKDMCVVEEIESIRNSGQNVEDVLKKVYAGLGSKYNTKVIIETNNNVYDTSLIFKSKDELITKENAIIKVKDIKKITIKK